MIHSHATPGTKESPSLSIGLTWNPDWYFWSRYARGEFTAPVSLSGRPDESLSSVDIYRRKSGQHAGQVRLYCDTNLDGVTLFVNGENVGVLRARGRHGRLYFAVKD